MSLILVTEHASKRFKQRKGINLSKPHSYVKPLVAIAAMKAELFKNKPKQVFIDGDRYQLSYNKSVEGTDVCTIHTVITPDTAFNLKVKIKSKLMRWLNDW
jgi:hypothetical protein